MVRPTPIQVGDVDFGSLPLAIALFVSVSAFVALCAKHASHTAKKYAAEETMINTPKLAPRSPLPSPKKLLATISNKAIPFMYKKKGDSEAESDGAKSEEDGFGEGGLWQKTILMGGKCQPPEFSGVIFYDGCGKRVSEPPRSPRASPLPSFSFPVAKDAHCPLAS